MKNFTQKEIKKAAKILKDGGLVAFPTETVFGLGVVFDNEKAYKRLMTVKKRPEDKPFTLMCASPSDIEKYAELNAFGKKLVSNFMPGQFTLITKAKEGLPEWCVSKDGMIGIRVPDSEVVRKMIKMVKKPLLVPSANKSGEAPATTSVRAAEIFKNEIDAVVEGEAKTKIPSTVVKVDKNMIRLVREGAILMNQIKEALK